MTLITYFLSISIFFLVTYGNVMSYYQSPSTDLDMAAKYRVLRAANANAKSKGSRYKKRKKVNA